MHWDVATGDRTRKVAQTMLEVSLRDHVRIDEKTNTDIAWRNNRLLVELLVG